jgi:hypothetical protein
MIPVRKVLSGGKVQASTTSSMEKKSIVHKIDKMVNDVQCLCRCVWIKDENSQEVLGMQLLTIHCHKNMQ